MEKPSIAIMLRSSVFSGSQALTALEFARSVINQEKAISLIFFYDEAVSIGSTLPVSLQSEPNLIEQWQSFIAAHEVPAVVCITAAVKRGVLDDNESQRYSKPAATLANGFRIGGLGEWIDAVNQSDQHIIFG